MRSVLAGRACLLAALSVCAPAGGRALALELGAPYAEAGAGWAYPIDSSVRTLYSGAPAPFGGLGYTFPPWLRVVARGGWYHRTAHPSSLLAASSSSALTLIPVSLEGQAVLPSARVSPFVLAGPAVVFARERFTSVLLESANSATGKATDWGAVAGLGLETRGGGIAFRLVGRLLMTGGHRAALRATGRADTRSTPAHASLFSVGLEAALP